MRASSFTLAAAAVIACMVLAAVVMSADKDKGTKYLIVHADDAGMSHTVNLGTIEGLEKGAVSSASIMVPCPWFTEIAEYARNHPEKDFGLHLTLTSEWKYYRWGPVASRDKVPSLIDENGFLWKDAALVGKHAKAEEVEIEIRAQIEKAKAFGVPVTHLDSHMGSLGSRADLLDVYAKMGVEYNLPILFSRDIDPNVGKGYPAMVQKRAEMVGKLDAARLPVVDFLPYLGLPQPFEPRKEAYLKAIRSLQPGVTEFIIHLAVDNEELRAITPQYMNRENDRRVFLDPEVKAEIERQGIKLIGWKQFRAMTSPGGS